MGTGREAMDEGKNSHRSLLEPKVRSLEIRDQAFLD